jgi:hypothetical protein
MATAATLKFLNQAANLTSELLFLQYGYQRFIFKLLLTQRNIIIF